MDPSTYLIYLLAATGLSLSPGPNSLLALTHGALYGWRRALFTIAGGAVGFVLVMALCMFGIGALIKASPLWLTALKWGGGAYLVWIGMQVWHAPPVGLAVGAAAPQTSSIAMFRQGAMAASTNPKGLLFFAAFLPQFIDVQRSLFVQYVVMALTFAVIEIATELLLAMTAHRISPWLARVGRRFNHVCGGLFMAIGIALPLRG
jgi:homoserine/homoserine lactone efflux protein